MVLLLQQPKQAYISITVAFRSMHLTHATLCMHLYVGLLEHGLHCSAILQHMVLWWLLMHALLSLNAALSRI